MGIIINDRKQAIEVQKMDQQPRRRNRTKGRRNQTRVHARRVPSERPHREDLRDQSHVEHSLHDQGMGKEEQEANWLWHWTEPRRAAWKLRSHYGAERQYLASLLRDQARGGGPWNSFPHPDRPKEGC